MPIDAYLSFDLLVQKANENYLARVVNSPVGQASAGFAPPFEAPELAQFLAYVGLRAPIAGTQLKPEELLKSTGTRLFDALFHDEVLTSYRRSRDAAEREGKGLRVKLRLNDVPELADLPWEYVFDSTRQQFLALSKETPIVRFLELPEPVAPLAAPAPLHLLVVAASPADYPALDIETEWSRLNTALESLRANNRITVTRVQPPTLDALRAQLRKNEYHLLHFIGHGEYDDATGQGALVFQDEASNGHAVNDEGIATLLSDAGALRVVVLNACEGARVSSKNPFTGVAPRLVQQGIPAVIAMQFPISDPAAIQFATDIYATLADGYPMDAAVNEARRAIYFNGSVLEWGTPVLFMRADDGMIFEKEQPMQENETPKQGGTSGGTQGGTHGGINISGNAKVSVGRDLIGGDKIVQGDDIQGDVNTVTIGAGAKVGQVAAGRDITQSSGADDTKELAQKLAEVESALEAMRDRLSKSEYQLAKYQFADLQAELTGKHGAPNGARLSEAADNLVETVPLLGGPLGAVFQTAAAQKVLEETGTTDWSRSKFS